MMRYWQYRVRVYNAKGTRYVESRRILLDHEYSITGLRDAAERIAQEELRHLEGVPPDAPQERLGWSELAWREAEPDEEP